MSKNFEETAAIEQFLEAFGLKNRVDVEAVRDSIFNQRQQMRDIEASRELVGQFIAKCRSQLALKQKNGERRDPTGIRHIKKRVDSLMNESDEMALMMEFLVRCRQCRLFYPKDTQSNNGSIATSSSTVTPSSVQSSPFQRRSASRGRVLSTLTGDHLNLNESMQSSRSRANSSFTSYDSRAIGMERQIAGSQRTRSPFRPGGTISGIPTTTRASPLTASNHLFAPGQEMMIPQDYVDYDDASNGYSSSSHQFRGTPPSRQTSHQQREESPSAFPRGTNIPQQQQSQLQQQLRQTPQSYLQANSHPSVTSSIRAQTNIRANTPLHSRIGSAITETESTVCECLLSALLGIETRLFTPIHRKMTITSTASLSTTHLSVCQRVLSIANIFLQLSHKELPNSQNSNGSVTAALIAAIRRILGDYIADIDGLRRKQALKFHQCLPLIDKWQIQLNVLAMAHKIRNMPQLELLESLFVLHSAYSFDENRRVILDILLDYTMGVFCNQMMDWMTTGEVPAEKWMIEKHAETGEIVLKKVPIFITDNDARILLEIGKSLPRVESASDDDLESIDKATTVVRSALSPKLIFKKELSPLLGILRDVVCGIVMRMVLTTGRLKEHIHKATSFFFLSDPRFTATLYTIIKEASMGLRVGSASLSRQTVSSALAAALEATASTNENSAEKKKQKLKFTLDALTTLGSTPNVSSKMQFVQPLRPHYEPHMDLMKPIFRVCDDDYESIFHVIWAIDLARFSTQECSTQNLPQIMRFLVKNYSIRENATCLLNMLSHVFSIVNATLLRLRCLISVQLKQHLARFLASIDEKCVDVDDVIREHQKFVRRVSVVVFVRNNEKIEHELANLLRVAFEAQEFAMEFSATWNDVIETTRSDENVRKARIAEICQKRTLGVRMLLETVNKSQKKLSELLDEQITYGNDALID